MPDYGKISWQSTKRADSASGSTDPGSQMNLIFELCRKFIPQQTILKSGALLVEQRAALHEAHKKIIEEISQQPFLIAFIVWVREMASFHPEKVRPARLLLEHDCIGIKDKAAVLWTVGDAHGFDHRIVVDAIRCRRDLSIQEQELLVAAYISFIQWLSKETHGYIGKLEDPDLLKAAGKELPHDRFIAFIAALKEKERLVAKLLYYGGNPTLDEVLNIQIEDVDFDNKIIRYESQLISYPIHVFADIHVLAEGKKKGRLFLGRQNLKLHSNTIFRNFKTAALKAGFETTFSPALLTSSH